MTSELHDERGHHDWKSAEYVHDWITQDVTRDEERTPMLRRMLALSGHPAHAGLEVLDIGAGYGLLSRIVLEEFPNARVTLQDYSEPMLEYARHDLERFSDRTAFVLSDLTDPTWIDSVGGSFDLAVSAIAVHNLRDPEVIASVYEGVRNVLKPGGVFLDSDYVFSGGLAAHLDWLKQAGFERITNQPQGEHHFIFAAFVS